MTHEESQNSVCNQRATRRLLKKGHCFLKPDVHKQSDFGQDASLSSTTQQCQRAALQLICRCPLAHRKSIEPVRFASPRATDLHSMQLCQGRKQHPAAVSSQEECSTKHRFPGRPNQTERRSKPITAFSTLLSKSGLPHSLAHGYIGKHLFLWTR